MTTPHNAVLAMDEPPGAKAPVGAAALPLAPVAAGQEILVGDCREALAGMEAGSVHLVLTDPPYFLDGLDGGWSKGGAKPKATGSVGGLPCGMRFDPAQGRRLQEFLQPVFAECLRVLKPGGFLLAFSAPRLAHRMGVAAEDAGFEVRDQFAWRYRGRAQFKAFSLAHFARRLGKGAEAALGDRKTPQLRPQFESIICVQKPREGTFVDNWLRHRTGLIDAAESLDGKVPSTVMEVEKDPRQGHLTPKPVQLCEHLIRVFTEEGQRVLDPFLGSGTTCVAAARAGRSGIGVEIEPAYAEIARRRVEEALASSTAD